MGMFARVIVGAMMDHPKIDSLFLNAIAFITCAPILCVFAFSKDYTTLMILAGFCGLNFAPFNVNTSIVLGEMLPTEKIASGFGKSNFVMGVGSIAGPVLAGYVFDNTQNYRIIVFIEAFGFFLGGIACLISFYFQASKH